MQHFPSRSVHSSFTVPLQRCWLGRTPNPFLIVSTNPSLPSPWRRTSVYLGLDVFVSVLCTPSCLTNFWCRGYRSSHVQWLTSFVDLSFDVSLWPRCLYCNHRKIKDSQIAGRVSSDHIQKRVVVVKIGTGVLSRRVLDTGELPCGWVTHFKGDGRHYLVGPTEGFLFRPGLWFL